MKSKKKRKEKKREKTLEPSLYNIPPPPPPTDLEDLILKIDEVRARIKLLLQLRLRLLHLLLPLNPLLLLLLLLGFGPTARHGNRPEICSPLGGGVPARQHRRQLVMGLSPTVRTFEVHFTSAQDGRVFVVLRASENNASVLKEDLESTLVDACAGESLGRLDGSGSWSGSGEFGEFGGGSAGGGAGGVGGNGLLGSGAFLGGGAGGLLQSCLLSHRLPNLGFTQGGLGRLGIGGEAG
jgi:uncharacterized membrane protein YgcG